MRSPLTLACLAILAISPSFPQSPTLKEAIAFMDRMGKLDRHSVIALDNACKIAISSEQPYVFFVPTGVDQTIGEDGTPRSEFKWTGFEASDALLSVSLADIDPLTVKTDLAVSPEFVKAHHPVQPVDLESPDRAVVFFATRDQLPSIKALKFAKAAETPKSENRAGAFVVFHNRSNAERFVTALVSATKECSGKASDFPATPAHPLYQER